MRSIRVRLTLLEATVIVVIIDMVVVVVDDVVVFVDAVIVVVNVVVGPYLLLLITLYLLVVNKCSSEAYLIHLTDPSSLFVLFILHFAHYNMQSAHVVKCMCCKVQKIW